MDQSYIVQFPLTFCEGTRKAGVHLRFTLQVQVIQNGRPVEGTVESDSSKPFVVMTNQKQWEACERTLLLRDAFHDKVRIHLLIASQRRAGQVRLSQEDCCDMYRDVFSVLMTRCSSKFRGINLRMRFSDSL